MKTHSNSYLAATVFILAPFCVSSFAALAVPPPPVNNFACVTNSLPAELECGSLPDPAKVIADAAAVTTNRYPDANTVLVDDLVRESYKPDGTSVAVDDEFTKVHGRL